MSTADRTEIPDPSGIGVVIEVADGETIRIAKWIGHQDNNVAEYVALLEALQHAVAVNARTLRVYSDSEVDGETDDRRVRLPQPPSAFPQLDVPQTGAGRSDFSIAHISREDNHEANELANHAARRIEPRPSLRYCPKSAFPLHYHLRPVTPVTASFARKAPA